MRIAVPMLGKEPDALLRQARAIAAHPGADMAEWRADALGQALTEESVRTITPVLLRALAGKPLIFTLRTEGGPARADYAALLMERIETGLSTQIALALPPEREPFVLRLWLLRAGAGLLLWRWEPRAAGASSAARLAAMGSFAPHRARYSSASR